MLQYNHDGGDAILNRLPRMEVNEMAGKTEYKNKWLSENCDRVNLVLPKGRKDEIQATAKGIGESVNAFIGTAIDERMERLGGSQEDSGSGSEATEKGDAQ